MGHAADRLALPGYARTGREARQASTRIASRAASAGRQTVRHELALLETSFDLTLPREEVEGQPLQAFLVR
ncbi:hypothetical protein ABZ400_35840 [Streptomyces sp. NPDC005897]|uniref:hypothetical protein n=1 Tax=Streptomyces sp. NPDC005897 TaxID=3157081 RepID=UPI0033FC4A03